MSADTATQIEELATPYEVRVEAAAGVDLVTSAPWWGTRVYWRSRRGERWAKALLIDVHPFDSGRIEEFVQIQAGTTTGRRS